MAGPKAGGREGADGSAKEKGDGGGGDVVPRPRLEIGVEREGGGGVMAAQMGEAAQQAKDRAE